MKEIHIISHGQHHDDSRESCHLLNDTGGVILLTDSSQRTGSLATSAGVNDVVKLQKEAGGYQPRRILESAGSAPHARHDAPIAEKRREVDLGGALAC